MMSRIRNDEDVDPRVLEVEAACRSRVLTKLTESFSNPEDTFAWMVISWTLSFLFISIFDSRGNRATNYVINTAKIIR